MNDTGTALARATKRTAEASASRPISRVHTAEQGAALLQCTASWLKDQARQRRVPFTMIAGQYRFTDEHLAEIIRMNEQRPQAEVGLPVRRRSAPALVTEAGLRARPPRRTKLAQGDAR